MAANYTKRMLILMQSSAICINSIVTITTTNNTKLQLLFKKTNKKS